MQHIDQELVLLQTDATDSDLGALGAALEQAGGLCRAPLQRMLSDRLADEGMLLMLARRAPDAAAAQTVQPALGEALAMLAACGKADLNRLDPGRRLVTFKLAAFDMDSTLIPIECIDELAALVGRSAEVSALTEAAMRGEVADYDESLRMRVALLARLSADALMQLIERGIALNPGVEELTSALRAAGLRLIVLSGGFAPIVAHIAARIGAAAFEANALEVEAGLLSGKLSGRILNAHYKAHYLQHYAAAWNVAPEATMAFGDGANDLQMFALAGLSIAYRAKPRVAAQADLRLHHAGFRALGEHFAETRSRSLAEALQTLEESLCTCPPSP